MFELNSERLRIVVIDFNKENVAHLKIFLARAYVSARQVRNFLARALCGSIRTIIMVKA